jgi:hypothetical protein
MHTPILKGNLNIAGKILILPENNSPLQDVIKYIKERYKKDHRVQYKDFVLELTTNLELSFYSAEQVIQSLKFHDYISIVDGGRLIDFLQKVND